MTGPARVERKFLRAPSLAGASIGMQFASYKTRCSCGESGLLERLATRFEDPDQPGFGQLTYGNRENEFNEFVFVEC
jgi:hypothetical protein